MIIWEASTFGRGDGRSRTYEQLCLLAAKGREARQRKKNQELLADNAEVLSQFADEVNERVGHRGTKLIAVAVKGRQSTALRSAKALKQVSSGGKKHRLSATQMLEIAFDRRHNRLAAADAHGVSKRTVIRVLPFVAHTLWEAQLALLSNFRQFVFERRPDVAAAALMWDETSQNLSIDSVPGTKLSQQRSSPTVLVARLHFTVAYLGSSELKMYRELVLPPLALSTNAASSIHAALFRHPFTKPLLDLVHDIVMSAAIRGWMHEGDGHLANEKLHVFRYGCWKDEVKEGPRLPAGAPKSVLSELLLCQNHQINLTMVEAVRNTGKTDGKGIIPNHYCATLFLRMADHFLRIAGAIRSFVETPENMVWNQNPTPEDLRRGRAFRQELTTYLQDNLRHHHQQMSSTGRAAGQQGSVLARPVSEVSIGSLHPSVCLIALANEVGTYIII